MSDTFVKADSRNLPKVDNVMILEYVAASSQHNLAEIRGAKILMSSRDSYINTAVGYVKVNRTGSDCIVTAKTVPEHRISKKLYTVTCKIDEQTNTITHVACEDCAASAGMHFSQSVAIIQSQVGTIRGVQVLYSDQNPLSVDLVINMPQDGIRLIFDPVAQRLKVIEIYNMKLVKLRYSGMCFNSPEIQPSIEQVEHCFGATHPGLYDSQRHLFALNFRGLSFYFPVDSKFEPGYAHGLGSLQFPNGGSPVVSRTTIYYGSQHQASQTSSGSVCGAPLPELPLSCYRHQLHLRRCDVLRSSTSTLGLRLHMVTEGQGRSLSEAGSGKGVCRVVRFGSSAQRVCAALGAPARTFYKADDKMRIHRPTARRRPPPASDYFFNYFTLGLDVLFDAHTHQVKKFVLHTNYPGHYNFNMYHRCEFELTVQPDKCEAHSLVESVGAVAITAYSKWEVVSRALRVAERPVVLNRASSTNTTNPFGSTFCYGYQDMIFEVMSNNYIASITLYQPEGTQPHYSVKAIA